MRARSTAPTVVDLFASPELAPLSVLEAAVEIARLSLVAAHSYEPARDAPSLEHRAASVVIDAADALATAIQRYRLALARARDRDRDDLLPF
jgi:hypothetical protein